MGIIRVMVALFLTTLAGYFYISYGNSYNDNSGEVLRSSFKINVAASLYGYSECESRLADGTSVAAAVLVTENLLDNVGLYNLDQWSVEHYKNGQMAVVFYGTLPEIRALKLKWGGQYIASGTGIRYPVQKRHSVKGSRLPRNMQSQTGVRCGQ